MHLSTFILKFFPKRWDSMSKAGKFQTLSIAQASRDSMSMFLTQRIKTDIPRRQIGSQGVTKKLPGTKSLCIQCEIGQDFYIPSLTSAENGQ